MLASHSPDDVAALIEVAGAARGWRILVFHRFLTGPADDRFPPEYPIADFEQVLDHLLASGLDVVTVEEGLARIACTPPS